MPFSDDDDYGNETLRRRTEIMPQLLTNFEPLFSETELNQNVSPTNVLEDFSYTKIVQSNRP